MMRPAMERATVAAGMGLAGIVFLVGPLELYWIPLALGVIGAAIAVGELLASRPSPAPAVAAVALVACAGALVVGALGASDYANAGGATIAAPDRPLERETPQP